MTLPPLYKRTATGAIQQWEIAVFGSAITTRHGQVGGAIQETTDIVKAGKNAGRANATTPEQQALAEAQAKHLKQRKKGYVDSPEAAAAGQLDAVIEGGIAPMLAKSYEDVEVDFPVYVQPKLDGHRCIAQVAEDGSVSLWTRSRKRYASVPHVELALAAMAKRNPSLRGRALDGELYNHSMRSDFERLSSLVRPKEPREGHELVQYHVYDAVMPVGFAERHEWLLNSKSLGIAGGPVHLVETVLVHSEADLMAIYKSFQNQGYEGAIVRRAHVPYEVGKRSGQLLKVKEFQDAEFEIVDVEEGSGKLMGAVGAVILVTKDGKRFGAKPMGSLALSQKLWEGRKSLIGKWGTVTFQALTSDGIPRFPVFKTVRDE